MNLDVFIGVMIPFVGTTLGAAMVYFMRHQLSQKVEKALLGFAAGIMVAASVWSLLIPALEQTEMEYGRMGFLPIAIGLLVGIAFLQFLDSIIPHLHRHADEPEGMRSSLGKNAMLMLAVTLHNIPEGMAVGVLYAAYLEGNTAITLASALVLSIGIAIQNFPEGAIISMPLKAGGVGKHKAFWLGTASGAVEPIASVITIIASALMTAILPYTLAFAAGAMLYVVVEELIPETANGIHSNIGTTFFAVGFALMMSLDVALG